MPEQLEAAQHQVLNYFADFGQNEEKKFKLLDKQQSE